MPLWDDVRAPATGINPPGAGADPDVDSSDIGLLFDASGTEIVHIILQLPHDYLDGSPIAPHVHWEPTNTNTGTVLWRLEYRWRNNAETAGALTTADITPAANGTANKLQINGWGLVSKPDARPSSIFECKLSRVGGSDTYNADARLKEFDIHYQRDTEQPGTIFEYTDDVT